MLPDAQPEPVIVHSVPGAWLGQTETWLYNQLRFCPRWIETHVVCERLENLDQFPLNNLHAAASQPAWNRVLDGLRRRLRVQRHDGFLLRRAGELGAGLLHSHFGPRGWRDMAVARQLGIKHVVSFYGYDVNHMPTVDPRWHDRYRELFEHAALVLCEGPHMAGCIAGLGCPESKLRVHRLGVDLSSIDCRPRSWCGREPLRVLLAASFRPKKGLPLALEALGRISGEVDLEITIIGDETAAPGSSREKQRILDAIDRWNLNAALPGFQPHDVLMDQAYRHHLFIAPSLTADTGDTEGGAPVTLIEMTASGMPVVSSRHCDIPGVIRHGVSGYLAGENDVDDLVRQLRRMLAFADRWSDMGRAGRGWAEKHFDAAVQGERLAATYVEVIKGWRYHDDGADAPIEDRVAA